MLQVSRWNLSMEDLRGSRLAMIAGSMCLSLDFRNDERGYEHGTPKRRRIRAPMIDRRSMLKGIALSAVSVAHPRIISFPKLQKRTMAKETKIFDPADGFAPITDTYILTDSSVLKRGNRWWMYLAGRAMG